MGADRERSGRAPPHDRALSEVILPRWLLWGRRARATPKPVPIRVTRQPVCSTKLWRQEESPTTCSPISPAPLTPPARSIPMSFTPTPSTRTLRAKYSTSRIKRALSDSQGEKKQIKRARDSRSDKQVARTSRRRESVARSCWGAGRHGHHCPCSGMARMAMAQGRTAGVTDE